MSETIASTLSYFVDGDNGSNSNDGLSVSTPWLTLAKLFTSGDFSENKTVYLQGTFREFNTYATAIDGVTFRQWPDETQATIRGDTVVTGFVAGSGAAWYMEPGDGLDIKSVVVDWDATVDGTGRHGGHLTAAASKAACDATSNSWFYDTSTTPDRLYVNISAGTDPAGFTVAYCKGGNAALLKLSDSTNCTVNGINFALHPDGTAGKGYGLWLLGNGNTIQNCRFDDMGYHSFGIVGGAPKNNLISGCTCSGIAHGGIHIVYYADASGGTNNRGRNLTLYCHTLLQRDNVTPARAGSTVGGLYSHTDGVQVLNDIEWENCTASYWTNEAGTAFSASNSTTPSNEDDHTTYGARFIACTMTDAGTAATSMAQTLHCSFYRCRIAATVTTSNFLTDGNGGVAKTIGFFACEFVLLVSGAAGTFCKAWNATRYVFHSCSVIITTTAGTGTNERIFFAMTATGSVRAVNSIFCFANVHGSFRRLYNGDGAFGQASTPIERYFNGCVYVNVVDGQYSSNGTYNAASEWLASIDTNAVQTATSPFNTSPTTGALASDSVLRRTSSPIAGDVRLGYNGLPYARMHGAYQYGTVLPRTRAPRERLMSSVR